MIRPWKKWRGLRRSLGWRIEFEKKVYVVLTKHTLKKAVAILSLPLAFLCVVPNAEAKQVTVEATGQYTVGDGPDENISAAKECARVDAMRMAAEQGGVFVEGITQVRDAKLTRDEVNVITAQVMQVAKETMQPVVEGTCVKYVCKIVATIDTDAVDIDKYIANKTALNENLRLQKEISRLKQENNELKEKYKTATTASEKTAITEQVKDNGEALQKAVVEIPVAKDKFTTRAVDSSSITYNKNTGIITFKMREFGSFINITRTMRIDVEKNSIQYIDMLDESFIAGKKLHKYKKENDSPSPIWGPRFGTQEAVRIYQYLGIEPSNMYRNADWRLIYTAGDGTMYYMDMANSRYDSDRALASFPVKRYNKNGLYKFMDHMNYTDYNLFYYDYVFGRIGIWEDGINYNDSLVFDGEIVAACKQAKSICVMDGRKASIWEQ